jgi:hypothetical protein
MLKYRIHYGIILKANLSCLKVTYSQPGVKKVPHRRIRVGIKSYNVEKLNVISFY